MSNQRYEQFLVGVLTSWSEEGNCQPGKRFHYQFSDSNDSARLYRVLSKASEGVVEIEGQQIPYIETAATKLIFVRHADANGIEGVPSYSESYISMLRDQVASQSGEFGGVAMLILHNSLLDTLLGTSEDLKLSVWSHDNIYQSVKEAAIDVIRAKPAVGHILDFQSETLKEEGSSIFGLRGIFETVANQGQFDLRPLGFLPDIELMGNWSGNAAQAKKRLQKNKDLKDRIDHVLHHYPDEVAERLPEFGEKFVKKHISVDGDWADKDYSKFVDEISVHAGDVLSFSRFESDLGCTCIGPRTKGQSAAQHRDMHVICLLDEEETSFRLDIEFDTAQKNLKPEEIQLWGKDGLSVEKTIKSRSKGKQTVTLKFDGFNGQPIFERIRLKRDNTKEKYSFSLLVLRKDDFYVEGFQNNFLVLPQKRLVALQTKDTELKLSATVGASSKLENLDDVVVKDSVGVLDYTELYETSDVVSFGVQSGEHIIKFHIEGETNTQSLRLPLLLDQGRFSKLFNDEYNGAFFSEKKRVVIDNSESSVVFERLELLRREEQVIKDRLLYSGDHQITVDELDASYTEVKETYLGLLKYCDDRRTTPSLVSWGEEFCRLVREFIVSYEKALNSIPKNVSLTQSQRDLMQLGFAKYGDTEFITPFHPIVLSYYLYLVEQIKSDPKPGSFKNLPPVTTSRLNAKGLLPYVFEGEGRFAFTQTSEVNMFWLEVVPQEESSYSFVTKLVLEKIDELVKTFKDLFNESSTAPLVVNSVNNGANKEVFLGVLEYLKKYKLKSQSVHVNIYGSEEYTTEFEEFAEMGSYDQIKQLYNFKGNEESDQVIDLMRTRVSFSKFNAEEVKSGGHQWCHISFFKNNERISPTSYNLDEHISGVACDGILNGESSYTEGDNYFTAFGLKRVNDSEKSHLKVARLVNNLLRPARQASESYSDNSGLRLAVNDRFKSQLEVCYKNSLWTTIIDPKVTLNFFEHEQELILIHYSDQYTNSAGYDAITVTSHAELYDKMLSSHGKHLLGEFNAFNGEWLLKMVSANDTIKLERKGIIAAWKLVCGLLAQSDISWIPLSIAEMVRVSGNIGLKLSGNDFSVYFKKEFSGKMSDDVLFVGFKGDKMFLLPLEVKAGKHGSGSMAKACEQVEKLRDYLVNGLLGLDSLEGKIYRSLFIRQVLMQVEKYQLYEVFPDNLKPERQYKHLLNQREEFLTGDYTIAELAEYPEGIALGILSNESCLETSSKMQGDVLQIEIPDSYLDKLLGTPTEQLTEAIKERAILNLKEECYLLSDTERIEGVEALVDDAHGAGSGKDGELTIDVETEDTAALSSNDGAANSRVLLGDNAIGDELVYWEYGHKELANKHMIIFGGSGQGKTYCIQGLMMGLSTCSVNSLVVDYTYGFLPDQLENEFVDEVQPQSHFLCNKPMTMSPFRSQKQKLGKEVFEEKPYVTAGRIASVFNKVYSTIGEKQIAVLNNVIESGLKNKGVEYSFYDMLDDLENDDNGASLALKLSTLVKAELFSSDGEKSWEAIFNDELHRVNILQMANLPTDVTQLGVEFILWDLYGYACSYGSKDKPLPIVLDEVQNLDHRLDSPLGKMLTEGRKFGISLILATQTLSVLKQEERDRLFQASHKLFFAPAKTETQKYAKILELSVPGTKQVEWEKQLGNLKKGECLSVGLHMTKDGSLENGVKKVRVSALGRRDGIHV